MAPPMTTLYRLYSNAGRLLYVGVADNWPSRMKQHAREKPWWGEVASTRFEQYDSRDKALSAEAAAIRSERPIHNVLHNSEPVVKPLRRHKVTTRRNAASPDERLMGFQTGEVVALGLYSGKCPIGLVAAVKMGRGIKLDLYSFLTGCFGHEVRTIAIPDVKEVVVASLLSGAEKRHLGYDPTLKVWDIDPLSAFQSRWEHNSGQFHQPSPNWPFASGRH